MRGQRVDKPLVSVIMPVYNAQSFIKGALDSVRRQTYRNIELVVVNDGSTDETPKIIKKYRKQFPNFKIRVYSYARRMGLRKAIKLALSKTKGKFISRLDADDIMDFERVQKQLDFLNENSNAAAVGGAVKIINEEGQIIGSKASNGNLDGIYSYIARFLPYHRSTLMFKRSKFPMDFAHYDAPDKIKKFGEIGNIDDVVLFSRLHDRNHFLNFNGSFLSRFIPYVKEVIMKQYDPYKRRVPLKMRFAGRSS